VKILLTHQNKQTYNLQACNTESLHRSLTNLE
jgi:hypothetical protein